MRKLVYFILFAAFVVQFLLFRPKQLTTESYEGVTSESKEQEKPSYSLEEFTYRSSDGLIRKMELQGKYGRAFSKENRVEGDIVYGKIFDEKGDFHELWGDHANYQVQEKILTVHDHVILKTPDQMLIRTEKVIAFQNKDELQGPSHVDGEQLSATNKLWFKAESFDLNKNTGLIHLRDQVEVKLQDDKEHKILITKSDFAQIFKPELRMDFSMRSQSDFVDTKYGDLRVFSREQSVFRSKKEKNQIQLLTALKDVRIEDEGFRRSSSEVKYATCQLAEFKVPEDTIYLKEFPAIYQKNDTVSGSLIVMHRAKKKIEVIEANSFYEGSHEETHR